jgi:hypothetical protein
MGKLQFGWDGNKLHVSQCNHMESNHKLCRACKYRFKCFTQRAQKNDTVLTIHNQKLSDVLAKLETTYNIGDE